MDTIDAGPSEFRIIARALSSELRIRILELLREGQYNLNEIASELSIPLSTATVNVQKLEEAGLVSAQLEPGRRGTQKLCSLTFDRIIFDIHKQNGTLPFEEISIPVGHYSQAEVTAPCGICTGAERLGKVDDRRSFFLPERFDAQLIWFTTGFLEYNFPINEERAHPVESLEFSAEICSEVPYYNNKAESDITLWINGQDVGSWRSPGDFGGTRGKITPKWWGRHKTQYGKLVTWKITDEGTFCDNQRISGITLDRLQLSANPSITVRLGVKEDAEHAKGMNLFGRQFGNHPTDLVMRFHYKKS